MLNLFIVFPGELDGIVGLDPKDIKVKEFLCEGVSAFLACILSLLLIEHQLHTDKHPFNHDNIRQHTHSQRATRRCPT